MDDYTSRFIVSAMITAWVGFGAIGARFIIREAMAKAYCECRHEFNEHVIIPRGFVLDSEIPKGEPCKFCSCKHYKRNPKDPRNTPPVKFF